MVELGRLFRETGDKSGCRLSWERQHCVDDADARDYREFTSADPKEEEVLRNLRKHTGGSPRHRSRMTHYRVEEYVGSRTS